MKKLNIKEKIKEIRKAEIPEALQQKYMNNIIISYVMIALAIILTIMLRSFTGLILPLILAFLFYILGLAYRKTVLEGYEIIEGEIIERTHLLPVSARRSEIVADGFVVVSEEGKQYKIQANKSKNSLPVGTKVRLYVSTTTTKEVLGYEILSV